MLESELGSRGLREMLEGQSPERYPEIRAVERVYERVDRRVDPPEPGQVPHDDGVALPQERHRDVIHEERQPARYEPPDDDAEGLRGLGLPAEGGDARRRLVVQDRDVQAERLRPGAVVRRERRGAVEAGAVRGQGVGGEGVVEVRAEGARAVVGGRPAAVRGVLVAVLAQGLCGSPAETEGELGGANASSRI